MGARQSRVDEQRNDMNLAGSPRIETSESQQWTACEIPGDLLTMESWTLVGGDVVASFTKENPMGGRIVSGSADYTVRIWDADKGSCVSVPSSFGHAVLNAEG